MWALKRSKYLALKACHTLHLFAWNETTDKVKEVQPFHTRFECLSNHNSSEAFSVPEIQYSDPVRFVESEN